MSWTRQLCQPSSAMQQTCDFLWGFLWVDDCEWEVGWPATLSGPHWKFGQLYKGPTSESGPTIRNQFEIVSRSLNLRLLSRNPRFWLQKLKLNMVFKLVLDFSPLAVKARLCMGSIPFAGWELWFVPVYQKKNFINNTKLVMWWFFSSYMIKDLFKTRKTTTGGNRMGQP